MKISHRLYLAQLPSLIAVLLIASLAYWGQYAHEAPVLLVVLFAIAVLVSATLTWWNARHVVARIERLATIPGASSHTDDEIEQIEHTVDRLSTAVRTAETSRLDREGLLEQRVRDYAQLLAVVADDAALHMEQVRLPLHILLENRFGDLNENQEEMLESARAAAEQSDSDMLTLKQVAELDLGVMALRHDRIKPSELIEAIRPMLLAAAEGERSSLEIEVEPLLPPVFGDRGKLQEALVTLLRTSICAAPANSRLFLRARREEQELILSLAGGRQPAGMIQWVAAARMIAAHQGVVAFAGDVLELRLRLAGGK